MTEPVFSVKQYQQELHTVLAACDKDLLGRIETEGKLRLDVAETFYGGQEMTAESLRTMMGACTIANFVGEQTINLAIETGIIQPENVATVNGVPHAQMMRL